STLRVFTKRQNRGGSTGDSAGLVSHTSTPVNGNSKLRGNTATTVAGCELKLAVLPTRSGSPPNRRVHNSALIIATGGPPGLSSSERKLRPSRGLTPRMSRKLAETRAPF